MPKNRSNVAKLLVLVIMMAFLVIPIAYSTESISVPYVHRDIASVITPFTWPYGDIDDLINAHWMEANAVQSMFHEYLSSYVVLFLTWYSATFSNIMYELNNHPTYFHLATEGSSGPSLKHMTHTLLRTMFILPLSRVL